jgi:hypothetical protein
MINVGGDDLLVIGPGGKPEIRARAARTIGDGEGCAGIRGGSILRPGCAYLRHPDSPVRVRYAQARSRSHGGLPSRRLYARRRNPRRLLLADKVQKRLQPPGSEPDRQCDDHAQRRGRHVWTRISSWHHTSIGVPSASFARTSATRAGKFF